VPLAILILAGGGGREGVRGLETSSAERRIWGPRRLRRWRARDRLCRSLRRRADLYPQRWRLRTAVADFHSDSRRSIMDPADHLPCARPHAHGRSIRAANRDSSGQEAHRLWGRQLERS